MTYETHQATVTGATHNPLLRVTTRERPKGHET